MDGRERHDGRFADDAKNQAARNQGIPQGVSVFRIRAAVRQSYETCGKYSKKQEFMEGSERYAVNPWPYARYRYEGEYEEFGKAFENADFFVYAGV